MIYYHFVLLSDDDYKKEKKGKERMYSAIVLEK